ncbi:MAGa7180 family putative nuclease [[Mycoplasma] collis]|uniref:MAGa7180 family putative nuclease n=1 Tax=[Mycoplasma] collis TaxID=2127 RepID=UPI00051AB988|nr:YqaJ viral recombinase family protein [[Mycoplasma] collis]
MKNTLLKQRKYYNNSHYFIDKEKKVLILENNFFQSLKKNIGNWNGFKKIGGSSLGDVLLTDQFKSQFLAFIRMSKLDMPILDKKYINAGIAIEPKVISVIEKKINKKVITFPPDKYQYDFFKDKDNIVGGIPDGYIEDLNLLIEIKTTQFKNLTKWENEEIPISYLKQAQLYAYLMNVEQFAIVAAFLEEQDYINPENFPIEKRHIKVYKYKLNKSQVEDDIEKIKTWYLKYTNSGISPEYNLKLDGELLEYLECQNIFEWEKLIDKWILMGKIKI